MGNEESSEWDLGNWFNRRDLAAKLKSNLRPLMIQKLVVDKTMDTDEIHDFIEDWVDSSSPQRTLFRPKSEQIN